MVLRQPMHAAATDGGEARNVVALVRPPKVERRESSHFTAAQARQVLTSRKPATSHPVPARLWRPGSATTCNRSASANRRHRAFATSTAPTTSTAKPPPRWTTFAGAAAGSGVDDGLTPVGCHRVRSHAFAACSEAGIFSASRARGPSPGLGTTRWLPRGQRGQSPARAPILRGVELTRPSAWTIAAARVLIGASFVVAPDKLGGAWAGAPARTPAGGTLS
jgi:hypothetical protein